MDEKTVSLYQNAPIPKMVLNNVIPAMVSSIMSLIYSLADTYFIGRVHDPLMVAAVSLVTPMYLIFISVGTLFGVGGTSLISRTLGGGDHKKTKNISSFCFWTGLGIGILLLIVVTIFCDPICRLIGASEDTMEYASQYLHILTLGAPFQIINATFSNIIRAEGKPRIAMCGTVGGNLLNVVLDPIFILSLGLHMRGAAIATLIGCACASCFYIIFICSKHSSLSLNPRNYRVNDKIASSVLSIGIPAAINTLLMSVSNMVINNIITGYGDLYLAGLGVALRIHSIVTLVITGIGIGVQPLFGFCFGAGNRKRYMAVLRFSLLLSFFISLGLSIVCFVFAEPLVGLFLSDASASQYGLVFARLYVISGPIVGLLYILTNAIQGAGAVLPALVLSLCRQGVIFIPVVLILNAVSHNPNLVGAGQAITDVLTFLLAVCLFIYVIRVYFKKRMKVQTQEET